MSTPAESAVLASLNDIVNETMTKFRDSIREEIDLKVDMRLTERALANTTEYDYDWYIPEIYDLPELKEFAREDLPRICGYAKVSNHLCEACKEYNNYDRYNTSKYHIFNVFFTLDGQYFTLNSKFNDYYPQNPTYFTHIEKNIKDTFEEIYRGEIIPNQNNYKKKRFNIQALKDFTKKSNSRPPMPYKTYKALKLEKNGERLNNNNCDPEDFQRFFDSHKPDMQEAAMQLYKAELMVKDVEAREKCIQKREAEINLYRENLRDEQESFKAHKATTEEYLATESARVQQETDRLRRQELLVRRHREELAANRQKYADIANIAGIVERIKNVIAEITLSDFGLTDAAAELIEIETSLLQNPPRSSIPIAEALVHNDNSTTSDTQSKK